MKRLQVKNIKLYLLFNFSQNYQGTVLVLIFFWCIYLSKTYPIAENIIHVDEDSGQPNGTPTSLWDLWDNTVLTTLASLAKYDNHIVIILECSKIFRISSKTQPTHIIIWTCNLLKISKRTGLFIREFRVIFL